MLLRRTTLLYIGFTLLAAACGTRRAVPPAQQHTTAPAASSAGAVAANTAAPLSAVERNNEAIRRRAQLANPNFKRSSTLEYIQQFKDVARREMNLNGIPASITLAQGILESGSGNSDLSRYANNHFGIKTTATWKGDAYYKDDDIINDSFRVYSNADESFIDHSNFLKRQRYSFLFTLKKDDYVGWANGLKQAGYATNPKYAALLIGIIEKYGLARYDLPESDYAQVQRETRVIKEIVKDIPKEDKKFTPVEKPVTPATSASVTPPADAKPVQPYEKPLPVNNPPAAATVGSAQPPRPDTVYIRDTVYLQRTAPAIQQPAAPAVIPAADTARKVLYTPPKSSSAAANNAAPAAERPLNTPDSSPSQPAVSTPAVTPQPPIVPRPVQEYIPERPLIIKNQPTPKYYTVSEGDTLESIARRFNITPAYIKQLNKIPAGPLPVGNVLKLLP